MKYSTKVSDAVHILVLIALNPMGNLTSTTIAESVHTNPGFIRQIMMSLRKGGLIISSAGRAKPELTKQPKDMTIYDIYKAIEGDKPLLHLDTHTNPACGVGMNIQFSLQDYYDQIQIAAETEMKKITLQDVIDGYNKKTAQILI